MRIYIYIHICVHISIYTRIHITHNYPCTCTYKYSHFFKPPVWNSWTLLGIPSYLYKVAFKINFHPRHLDDIACCLALAICLACISPRRWKGDVVFAGEEAPKDIEVGVFSCIELGTIIWFIWSYSWSPRLKIEFYEDKIIGWGMIQVLWNFLTLDFDSGILAASIINALPRTYLSTTFLQNLDPSSPLPMPNWLWPPNEERLENIKRRRLVLLAQTPISKDEFYTEKKKTCRSNLTQKTWHQPDWYESDPESSTIVSCSSVQKLQKILPHIWAHLSPLHLAQKRK